MKVGVYQAVMKDGTIYYRASLTYNFKHISLGSYPTEALAHKAYLEGSKLLEKGTIASYSKGKRTLSFDKWVCLVNLRDNGIYIKTPIYLHKQYFEYHFSQAITFKFDVDDLFYYSHHKIMKRGGHLFVSDYGMQVNILNRYGIKNFAVAGKDYIYVNGDPYDLRHMNIEIINHYHGVTKSDNNGNITYVARIIVNGAIKIGTYRSEEEAAVAYNKAADILKEFGVVKDFPSNYIDSLSESEYASMYNRVRISKSIREFQSPS